jgi:hypothetical protein
VILRRLAPLLLAVSLGGGPGRPPAVYWFLPSGRPDRAPSRGERVRAAAFVEAARVAMARWSDVSAAMSDGYEPQSQGPVVHYVNATRLVAGPVDPAAPTALVFASGHLVGAMWMMVSASTPAPDVGGPLAPWHAHVECRSAWASRLVPVGAGCRRGEQREITPAMLHVWAAGRSHRTCPRLRCNA